MGGIYEYSIEPRIMRLRNTRDMVYFWSIKHQKLLKLRAYELKAGRKCQLCIPKFSVKNGLIPCEFRYTNFYQVKRHFVCCENKFGRPLVWSSRSEIPVNLRRERELGDLSLMLNAQKLQIEFDTITLIKSKDQLMKYFKTNPCPCQDDQNNKCSLKINSYSQLLGHLSALELRQKKYLVRKGEIDIIKSNSQENHASSLSANEISQNGELLEDSSVSELSEVSVCASPFENQTKIRTYSKQSSDIHSFSSDKLSIINSSSGIDSFSGDNSTNKKSSGFNLSSDESEFSEESDNDSASFQFKQSHSTIVISNDRASRSRSKNYNKPNSRQSTNVNNVPILSSTKINVLKLSRAASKNLSNQKLTYTFIDSSDESDREIKVQKSKQSEHQAQKRKIDTVTQDDHIYKRVHELSKSPDQIKSSQIGKYGWSDSEDEEILINSIYQTMKTRAQNK